MDIELFLGLLLVAGALAAILGMVLWSRWMIEKIAREKFETARDIVRELENGR